MTQSMPLTSRSLPIALLRARERVMSPIRTMLSAAGITEQQWRVLRVLDEGGPMEPTRIADLACLLLPSLTRILQKLEEKKLIERRRDPRDRRKQIVRITGSGVKVIKANLDTATAIMRQVREELGADRHELLLDLLNELENAPRD